jgi:PAS domain S-box-containing protein
MAHHFEDVVWLTDKDIGKVLYINPAYERTFRRTSESVYERMESFLDKIHPEDRGRVEQILEENRKGVHGSAEYRIIWPDGSVRWILRRTFPIRNSEGDVYLIAGIAQDVTDRRRDQEALRESEERYRDLVENSRELICTHDFDGLILSANRASVEVLGYAPEDFVGKKNFRDLLVPAVRDRFDDYMARIRHDGFASGLALVQTSEGNQRVLEYHNTVRTEGVATPIVRGMASDVTEQWRAEKALRESEERYRELFENAKDPIYVHDLSGRYTSVNRAAEKLSGFSRDEIIGKHYSNFVAPRHLKFARTNLCQKLDQENETIYEVLMITKDRQAVPVEISSRLIYENGVAVGVQGVARDVTERKRAQEALQTYSRRLIEAQEAERQHIARELHDEIGQILTAVKMNLQSIQRSSPASTWMPPLDESIGIVDEALSRVRDLSIELRPALLDDLGLNAALRWYVDHYAQRTGIMAEVRNDFEEDGRLPRELEDACFRIAQEALTNVARHAQATKASVQLRHSSGNLSLTIADDGVGFDVESVNQHQTSALGLLGMLERADAVGGKIEIDSVPNKGTRINARFPIRD